MNIENVICYSEAWKSGGLWLSAFLPHSSEEHLLSFLALPA